MRNDNQSFSCYKPCDGCLNNGLIFRIGKCRGLIQHHDRTVLQDRPCNGDTLPFSAGEAASRIARQRIIALRQSGDEIVTARFFCRCLDLCVCGLRFSNPNVFPDRQMEQEVIL